jgi:SET domain-containing protein
MTKKQFIKSLDKVYCRLGVSKHGVGTFAIRNIPKGVNPFEGSIDGFIAIKPEELKGQPRGIKKMIRDFCAYQDGEYYVPSSGMNSIDVSYYINHSKTPNMIEQGEGIDFFTNRLIKKGEELTVDYDTYDDRGL